jgi:hypothetical protein
VLTMVKKEEWLSMRFSLTKYTVTARNVALLHCDVIYANCKLSVLSCLGTTLLIYMLPVAIFLSAIKYCSLFYSPQLTGKRMYRPIHYNN